MIHYAHRSEAGALLAELLSAYRGQSDAVVLALPRGGVPVAYEVAERLHLPMDVMPVRRLPLPGQEGLTVGAIAPGGIRIENEKLVSHLHVPEQQIADAESREREILEKRLRDYRGENPELDLRGKQVILVDDGLTPIESMRAALAAVNVRNAARVIIALPVATRDIVEELSDEADEVVCPVTPEDTPVQDQWYRNDPHATDEDVRDLLAHAWREHPP